MKNIIITGSANGVGKAIANVLKEEKLIHILSLLLEVEQYFLVCYQNIISIEL